jgi:hypothetical protein
MFPLVQTAAAILGAGFLFVTGLVVTDNVLFEEGSVGLEPEAEMVVEAAPTNSPEPIAESEVATSAPNTILTPEVGVPEAEVITTIIPTTSETGLIPVETPREEMAPENSPNLATTSESTAPTPEMEAEVVLLAVPEEVITIDDIRQEVVEVVVTEEPVERGECYLGSFGHPVLCMREIRHGQR